MRAANAILSPFKRMFNALKTANQQTYCGDSDSCQGLSYAKGNLNQDIPKRVPNWDSCPVPDEHQRAKR